MGCPTCGNQKLVTDYVRGEVICSQCGLVVETVLDTGPRWSAESYQTRRSTPLKVVTASRWSVLAKYDTPHCNEKALASLLTEIRRISACMGLPRHVVKEAEILARLADTVGAREEVAAAALLWLVARRAKVLKPLKEYMACSGAEKSELMRVVAKFAEVTRSTRPRLEDYVRALSARMGLQVTTVKKALEILQRNRRTVTGRNPWVCASAALYIAANRQIDVSRLATEAGISAYTVRQLARKLKA